MAARGNDVDERTKLIDPSKQDDDDDPIMLEMKERNDRKRMEEEEKMKKTSTHGGARPKTQSYKNPSYEIGDDIPTVDKRPDGVVEIDENQIEAWKRIEDKYPNVDKSKFTARLDEFNNVLVKIIGGPKSKFVYHYFFNNDELNRSLPKTIRDNLGSSAEDIKSSNEDNNNADQIKIDELKDEMRVTDISERERNNIQDEINRLQERIRERNQMNNRIQNRMLLKDRIKAIFKKHGFTAIAVISAVGVVISVIISNLKTGLAKMAKGVGNGLKDIGKKLGAILPGMIGAIASFIFKTAGEVIGFLAKNAWLLIMAVVIFFIDQFKKKNK